MHTSTRTGPRRAAGVVAVLAATLVLPTTAGAAPAPAGHSAVDGQASRHAPTDGPSSPGIAWRTDLGVDLGGRGHEDPYPIDAAGHVFVSGRVEAGALSGQGYLNAVDASTGVVLWKNPVTGIEESCHPAVTNDGRVIAQLDASSGSDDLVAYETTGGQVDSVLYSDPDLRGCPSRLVLVDDLVLVPYGGARAGIRAVDVDGGGLRWTFEARTAADGAVNNGRNDQVVVDEAGTTAYYLSLKDASTNPPTWWLNAVRLSDGTVRDQVEVPGTSAANALKSIIAVDGGVVVALDRCDPGSGNLVACVARVDDDGSNLSLGWVSRPKATDGQRQRIASLTDSGTGVVAGWTSGNGQIYGLDVDTGGVVFRRDPSSFSNNGNQLITDADGTFIHGAFGGTYLEAFEDGGADAFVVPDCATSTPTQRLGEPATIGGIAPDGTLVTGNVASVYSNGTKTGETFVLLGLRDGSDAASGSCPATGQRVSGLSRVETAIEVSQTSFPQRDSADTVVIAVSTNYPDALAGGPLAHKADAPLLLTEREALNAKVRAEIVRLGARRAILLGGTAALSTAVESELQSMGLTTDRIAGADRFDTARKISQRVPARTVYVTEGSNPDPRRGWPDAVAVSGLAAFEQRPILLVARDEAPAATRAALADLNASVVVVVGGTVAVSDATAAALADYVPGGSNEARVVRVAGDSRFETSVKVAQRSVAAGASTRDLWFATGLAFPDALAAGPAVARSGGVLLLVNGQDPNGGQEVYDFLRGLSSSEVQRAWFVGGPAAISDAVADRLADAVGIQ